MTCYFGAFAPLALRRPLMAWHQLRWVAFCCSVLCGAARAEPVAVEYDAPPELDCPSEREFKAQVSGRLGEDPFGEGARRTVRVAISNSKRGPAAEVSWRAEQGAIPGVRRFPPRGQTCAELVANIVFAVTVHIELLRIERGTTRERGTAASDAGGATNEGSSGAGDTQTPETSAKPEDSRSPNDQIRSSPHERETSRGWMAGAGTSVLLGWSPRVSFGARVFVVRRGHHFAVEAAAEVTAPTRVERGPGSGFESSSWSGSLAPCFSFGALDGCAVGRIGQVRASGFGLDQPRSPDALLSQLGARVAFSHPIARHFSASAHGEALANLSPWRIRLNQSEVWSTPPVAATFGLSVSASFF